MAHNSSFDNKVLSNKLKEYFKNNIKLCLKTVNKLFIVTKSDLFYDIDIYDENIPSFILNEDKSIIEGMIVEELSHKKIIDITHGESHYLAINKECEIFCWGNNYFGQLGNGKKDKDEDALNRPELNELLTNLVIKDIKCGSNHSIALTKNGEIYGWGWNQWGQCGYGHIHIHEFNLIPIKVSALVGVKISVISCGSEHSMALSVKGIVYSWGNNNWKQLGCPNGYRIDPYYTSENPYFTSENIIYRITDVFTKKISCGPVHSLLLSNDGVIYSFGMNEYGQLGNGEINSLKTPNRLNHSKKFIDIVSHFKENISIALSFDNIYYIWGKFGSERILEPKETEFRSYNEIFAHYFDYSFNKSEELIQFKNLSFRDGYYEKSFIEISKLGEGSFGTVFEVEKKGDAEIHAIKKIRFKNEFKKSIFREYKIYSVVNKLLERYVVQHYDSWFENSINDKSIILNMEMEFCDKTLEEIIDEIESNYYTKINGRLTSIGYYLASQLFTEILECVQYLHKII
jgi:alpha-tubulin suppressor-like RCC1 family protein